MFVELNNGATYDIEDDIRVLIEGYAVPLQYVPLVPMYIFDWIVSECGTARIVEKSSCKTNDSSV